MICESPEYLQYASARIFTGCLQQDRQKRNKVQAGYNAFCSGRSILFIDRIVRSYKAPAELPVQYRRLRRSRSIIKFSCYKQEGPRGLIALPANLLQNIRSMIFKRSKMSSLVECLTGISPPGSKNIFLHASL